MKYAWIEEHKKMYSINLMCKVFKVNRSAYYHWKVQDKSEYQDEKLNELIESIFKSSRRRYGTRRIKKVLEVKYGVIVSRRKIAEIMERLKLKVGKKFKVTTTDSKHNYEVAPNILNREFKVSEIDKVYVGDITYVKTDEGWLYLSTVIDLYSRKVVGWSMDDNMRVGLVNNALQMAISRRGISKGLIWHTDRGSQYASDEHKKLLKKYKITQSMSRKGNCWDNAVAESFFHTLKTELVYNVKFETKAQANQMIFEYIEIFYNHTFLHNLNFKFHNIN